MGKMIDIDDFHKRYMFHAEIKAEAEFNQIINEINKTEAIPKADIQKALKEGSKDISENVLAIVREEYISKADYETRLKADLKAILVKLQLEIEELDNPLDYDFEGYNQCAVDCEKLIQQKINALKGE